MVKENELAKYPITIEIPFEEYKELLIIKGKYEELKAQQNIKVVSWEPSTIQPLNMPTLTRDDKNTADPTIVPPYKITCSQ